MVGSHHRLNGHEFEWTLGVGDGQGGLACCDSWGHKESDTTEQLNWTELNWTSCKTELPELGDSVIAHDRQKPCCLPQNRGLDPLEAGLHTWWDLFAFYFQWPSQLIPTLEHAFILTPGEAWLITKGPRTARLGSEPDNHGQLSQLDHRGWGSG